MNTNSILRCTALVAAILTSATVIAADPIDAPPNGLVSFADLKLDSHAGIRALYRRIEAMADRVCEVPRETRQLKNWSDLKTCRAGATERAVRLVNLPALDDLHLARVGRRDAPAQVSRAR